MNARNMVRHAPALEGAVGVALLAVALVALTSWPWAALAVGVAFLVDVGVRSVRS